MQFQSRLYAVLLALITPGIIAPPSAEAAPRSAPQFTIKQSDDRFSADGLTTFSSDGNRISKKSVSGGTHVDKLGVYLNPAVTLTSTGEIASLRLEFFNLTQRVTGTGELNSFGRPLRISFLTGEGAPIILAIEGGAQRYGEPYCGPYLPCMTSLVEGGLVPITIEQYRRLMSATSLAIKVDGTERSRVYEVADVATTFIENLKIFYEAHLASTE